MKMLMTSVLVFAWLILPSFIAQAQPMEEIRYRVEVLVIQGKEYPLFQFRRAGADACSAAHYHADGAVYSVHNDPAVEYQFNLGACGFGKADDLERKTIIITQNHVDSFAGADLKPHIEAVRGGANAAAGSTVTPEQERTIQTSLIVLAPLIVVSSAPLWGYIPHAPSLIYHFITWLVSLLRRKPRARFFGVVYDSISKFPLRLAIVRVFEAKGNRLVTTKVTDKEGSYDFLLPPGSYRLEVTKPGYQFPSQIVTSAIDGKYDHVYAADQGFSSQPEQSVVPDVALDPKNQQQAWDMAGGINKIWLALQRVGHYVALPLLIIGASLSLLMIFVFPGHVSNWLVFAVYVILLFAQIQLRPSREKAWGTVRELTAPSRLALATVQLIDPKQSKVLESRLSDYEGRFSFRPEPGSYVVKAAKEGYTQVADQGLREITIQSPRQQVTGDIYMQRK